MTARANTAKLRRTNERVKRAAEAIQWNVANPGRPLKYEDSFCYLAERISALGSTNAQLAEIFGVVESTISGWMASHPAFNNAVTRGRARADHEVEAALFRRAIGYSHSTVRVLNGKDGPLVVPYMEQYPPDTGAIIFWLKNRLPNRWRNRADAPGSTEDTARLLREQVAAMDKATRREVRRDVSR